MQKAWILFRKLTAFILLPEEVGNNDDDDDSLKMDP